MRWPWVAPAALEMFSSISVPPRSLTPAMRAWRGAQAGVHEPAQVVDEGLVEAAGPLGDLQGGEAVHVDGGCRLLHRPAHVDVVVAVEARVDPALEAHLGGALLDGFDHPALD